VEGNQSPSVAVFSKLHQWASILSPVCISWYRVVL